MPNKNCTPESHNLTTCCPHCGLAPKLPRNAETVFGFEQVTPRFSLWEMVQAAGIEFDHHETDLYLPVNAETQKLIDGYRFKCNVTMFTSQIDKKRWFDIPFAYFPAWDKKPKAAINR